jgi:hypothetical protein
MLVIGVQNANTAGILKSPRIARPAVTFTDVKTANFVSTVIFLKIARNAANVANAMDASTANVAIRAAIVYVA